jgi:hypothetical protein
MRKSYSVRNSRIFPKDGHFLDGGIDSIGLEA